MDEWNSSEFDTAPTPEPDAPKPPPDGRKFWYVAGALIFVLVLIVNSSPSYEIVLDPNAHAHPAPPVPTYIPVDPQPEAAPVDPAQPAEPVQPAPTTPAAPPRPVVLPSHAAPPSAAPGALSELVEQLEPSCVWLHYQQGGGTVSGTGFVIDDQGHIITNAHVVAYTDAPAVMTYQHQSFRGRVLARSTTEDLALVQADLPRDLPAVRLGNSDTIRLGEEILVMGFPVGLMSKVSVATGIVGSLRTEENRIQLSMAINPGNSGGPVISRATGEVVAVVVSKHARAEGMGFAIPVNSVKQFLSESGR